MKRIFPFLFLLFSCSDGDLQIEAIDFDDGTATFCPLTFDQDDTERTLFFKIIDDEALILELQDGLIENQTLPDSLTSTIGSNQSNLTYRLFSETVTNTYFCSEVPPISPTVLEEIMATSGTLSLKTQLDTVSQTTKTYIHDIQITDLTIVNSNDERITDEMGLDFGTYTTSTENSVALEFSNYEDIAFVVCAGESGRTVLSKKINDEYILLDFPSNLLANEITETDRTVTFADSIMAPPTFRHLVLDEIVVDEDICGNVIDSEVIKNRFASFGGTLAVTTVEAEESTDSIPVFQHTLTLRDLVLRDIEDDELPPIEEYVFDTVITSPN